MSKSAALLWFLIAAALAVAVWATSPKTSVAATGGPFLTGFSAAATERISVRWPDGAVATMTRGPLDGMWLLRTGEGEEPGSPWWPAESARVQGLLRLLGDIRQTPAAVQTAMPKAVLLDIFRSGSPAIHLAIDPNTLGGKGRLALLDDASRVVGLTQIGEDFVRVLERPSVDSWRVTDLLPVPPETGVSLTMKSGSADIELARAGSGWVMQRPIRTRADSGTVQGALLLLSKTALDRFLPLASGPESGLSPPQRELVVGVRSGDVRFEEHIEIGSALDGQSRVVRITARSEGLADAVWGPVVGVVDSASLAALGEDPGNYVAKNTVGIPAADIARVEVGPAGQNSPISRASDGGFGENDATVRELLRLLCETPAAVCTIRTDDNPYSAPDALAVRLLGTRGDMLCELRLRPASIASKIAGAPSTPALEVVHGPIVRLVPAPRARELLAALRGAAAKP